LPGGWAVPAVFPLIPSVLFLPFYIVVNGLFPLTGDSVSWGLYPENSIFYGLLNNIYAHIILIKKAKFVSPKF